MLEYATVRGFGQAETEVKKSRFVAAVWPVGAEAEAEERLAARQKEHRKANHNVYAYTVGLETPRQRASDDGEPAGTAGKPLLDVLEREGLRNTLIVVTRYFGGTLLGTGGLVRAYGQAAKQGLEAAGRIRQVLHTRLRLCLDYGYLGKAENLLQSDGHRIAAVRYSDRVELTVLVKQPEAEQLVVQLADLTGGQAVISREGDVYVAELL